MKIYSFLILIIVIILSQGCMEDDIIETSQTIQEVQTEKTNLVLESFNADQIPTLKTYLT